MYALNFYSPIVADQLRSRRKTATIRLGNKTSKYKKGMVVAVLVGNRFGARQRIFDAVIDKIEVKPLGDCSPREIERDNPAVGVAFGGNLIAIGLVALKAVFGDFAGWGESIAAFLVFGVLGFALLYVMRVLIDLVLLPTVKVSRAISEGHNVGVALVEGAVVISAAMILFVAI